MTVSPPRSFRRVAVLNRGEPALRFLRALREYNLEFGTALEAVAFFTDPDNGALFVRLADDAVSLGAPIRTQSDGRALSAYCDHDHVLALLKASRCDAVWPGWGFIAEDAAFVRRLEAEGIAFLGPSSASMDALGDKIASKQLAEQADVPLAPWRDITTADEPAIVAAGAAIGFPLMVKASAGGGGRGIRKVDRAEDLLAAVASAGEEARKAFGDGGLFVEACVTEARHVEVQFVCDGVSEAWALGVRDCSIQRRNQKVIEETPSPVLPAEAEARLCASATRLALAAGYKGVGTAEFLFRPSDGLLSFLEVNSRLQVEHTITEEVTGADLVHAQISIARGVAWAPPMEARGCAIEVRLNAEDPERGFQPAPGLVRVFRPPSGPGIRVDSGINEGASIAPEFDSMIAKVIAWGTSRAQAIARLRRALAEMEVVVENGATNKALLMQLLDAKEFREGTASTQWLDGAVADGWLVVPRGEREALLVAAIISYRIDLHAEMQRFFAEAQNGVPQNLRAPEGKEVSLRSRGRSIDLAVFAVGRDRYLVESASGAHRVTIESTGAHSAILELDGRRHRVTYSHGRTGVAVEIDGVPHTIERSTGGEVRAPAPAMVVHVSVTEGQRVSVGDRLCTLEAMKMEMPVFAEEAGIVQAVLCRANQQVIAGQTMLVLTPESDDTGPRETIAIEPSPPRPLDLLFANGAPAPEQVDEAPEELVRMVLDDLAEMCRGILLGYDIPSTIHERVDVLFGARLQFSNIQNKASWTPLVSLLSTFVEAESLFRRDALPTDDEAGAVSPELAFYDYCRCHHLGEDGVPSAIAVGLTTALRNYGVTSMEPTEALREALFRLSAGHAHGELRHRLASSLLRLVIGLHEENVPLGERASLRDLLEAVTEVASPSYPYVADNARQALYVTVRQAHYVATGERVEASIDRALDRWRADGGDADRGHLESTIATAQTVLPALLRRLIPGGADAPAYFDAALRRLYERRELHMVRIDESAGVWLGVFSMGDAPGQQLLAAATPLRLLLPALDRLFTLAGQRSDGPPPVLELLITDACSPELLTPRIKQYVKEVQPSRRRVLRLTISWFDDATVQRHRTFAPDGRYFLEDDAVRDVHPETAERLGMQRLAEFEIERLPSPERIHAFRGVAKSNPKDERVFVLGEVFGRATPPAGHEDVWPRWEFEKVFYQGLRILRDAQATRTKRNRLFRNRMTIFIHPTIHVAPETMPELARRLEIPTRQIGLDGVHVLLQVPDGDGIRELEVVVSKPGRHRLDISTRAPHVEPIRAMTRYEQRVVLARRLGYVYPYEIVRMLEGGAEEAALSELPVGAGRFTELELDATGDALEVVQRPYGGNTAGIVCGIIENDVPDTGQTWERVLLISDPTRSMGALAEAECRRVNAALDIARDRGIPVEWIAISAGARISMGSGTENLDWTARVLRRIVEFTQGGGELHVIVPGVNVGAQSYWNAEATMLMHTAGVLIMTPEGSMVLTGKKALEYSGSVAAEDERGIGGYERIMGPNGQAQYVARDLGDALRILFRFYRVAYHRRGALAPLVQTADPAERSILESPYKASAEFATVGEIFSDATNPGRKRPFAIREVMRAVVDADGERLERWNPMRHAETVVVWDAQVGGRGVSLIGIESQPLPRFGRVPVDGPDQWSGGTLFPRSSKKLARAINAASGRRPAVVLANLSGFDGSPESLRELQLEYGAEIGRAVVNFDGPIIFVVVGRYHGGAYVVFSKALNPNLRALALEGTFASVIGGGPAAAVVFPREVRKRTDEDPRVVTARSALSAAAESDKPRLREEFDELYASVLLERQGELAAEFDAIHSVARAVEVGSLDAVIAPSDLRARIIAELEGAVAGERGG